MARKPIIAGNWKMHKDRKESAELAGKLAASTGNNTNVDVVLCPVFTSLDAVNGAISGSKISLGAQNCHYADKGAYTGEISAAELAESGVRLAEIGHAERRRLFGETDELVAAKVAASLSAGVTPLLCVGEAEQQDAASAATVAVAQLRADLDGAPDGPVIVAYEPVWAIGAAEPAPIEHIAVVSRELTAALDDDPGREGSLVIYGGSAGPGLLTRLGDDVDGLFLGRFAHDARNFAAVLDEAVALASARREREASA